VKLEAAAISCAITSQEAASQMILLADLPTRDVTILANLMKMHFYELVG
jgi:hypothetical protein